MEEDKILAQQETTEKLVTRTIEEPAKGFPTWIDLVVMMALLFAGAIGAAIVMGVLHLAWPGAEKEVITAILYTVQFGLAFWWIWLYRRRRGGRGRVFNFTFRWYNSSIVLLGVVMILAGGVVLEPVLALFPDKYFEMLNKAIGSGGWAILSTVVLAPVCEEMLFRGLILESIKQKRGATTAVMLSALLFGLAHVPVLPQMLNAFVMGVVLGYVYVLTGSLVSVIIVHAVNNALSYLFMEITGSQQTDMRTFVGDGTVYWIVYGVCVVVFVGAIVWMALMVTRKRQKRSEFTAIFAEIPTVETVESAPENNNNEKTTFNENSSR
jgi:membrane protease YdiL (CAAX protease family)